MIMKVNSKPMNEFDQKARDWDKNKMNVERTIAIAGKLLKLIPEKPALKALEFGAGTGLLSFYLKDRFSEITLMDTSREMLKMAKLKMDKDDRSKFRTLFFNLENKEYHRAMFDVIYSQMVLHHIKDTDDIFQKFYHLLNPGGLLAVADLYPEDGSFHDYNMGVHRGFDPKELKSTLIQKGFQKYKTYPCFVMRKEISNGTIKDYPVFIMTAYK
jgi:ubiquinone/menaquinone biosynthesis C-methylase UbiE